MTQNGRCPGCGSRKSDPRVVSWKQDGPPALFQFGDSQGCRACLPDERARDSRHADAWRNENERQRSIPESLAPLRDCLNPSALPPCRDCVVASVTSRSCLSLSGLNLDKITKCHTSALKINEPNGAAIGAALTKRTQRGLPGPFRQNEPNGASRGRFDKTNPTGLPSGPL